MSNKFNEKRQQIIKKITENSPFDEAETSKIVKNIHQKTLWNVKVLIDRYQFDQKKVLDIGSSYGQSLFYWGKGSEGVEIQQKMNSLAEALGYKMHRFNVENGFTDLPKESYEAIYTDNLLEHLVAPHLFLMRLNTLLKKEGILAIGHPVVPPFGFRQLWGLLGQKGWLAVEHINFFTSKSAKLTLERAGFKVLAQYGFPRFYKIPFLNKRFHLIGPHCVSVCKKVENFQYNPKRKQEFDPEWAAAELDLFHDK